MIAARLTPRAILRAELALLVSAAAVLVLLPRSRAALWGGVPLLGVGLSGCFGGAVGQVQATIGLSGRMSGLFGAGALSGVSLVQLAAAHAATPEGIMRVVAAASAAAAATMAALWTLLPPSPAAGASAAGGDGDGGTELGALLGGDGADAADDDG